MTQKIINTGIADKGNGDPIRTAFTKVNENFAELYSQLAASVVVGATAPTGPEEGSLWWNSVSGRMYVYFGTAWVDSSPVDGAGISSTNELVNGAYTTSLGANGVLTLADGSIINGSTIRGVAGTGELNYTGITIGPNSNDAEKTWMWVDHANAYISTDNSANTWTFNDAGALTFPQGTTIATADGTDAFIIDGAVDKDVQIYTYSGETARGWTFGTDGSLQIPGDIRSEGNINIDINLSDSTLHRWSFGEDGELTLPGGRTRIGTAVGIDAIIANEDEVFGVVAQGTNGAVQLVWIEDSENFYTSNLAAVYVNSGGPGSVRIATGANGGPGPKFWEFNNSGALTLPGSLKITNSVISNVNGNTVIGGYDTANGITNVANENNNGYNTVADNILVVSGFNPIAANIDSTWIAIYDNVLYPINSVTVSNWNANVWWIDIGTVDLVIETAGLVNLYPNSNWTFGNDGTLTLPGDSNGTIGENATGLAITSEREFSIFANSVESFKLWRFGTDGALTLPAGGAIAESTNTFNIIGLTPAGPTGVPSSISGGVASTNAFWDQNPLSNLATTLGSGTGLTVTVTQTEGVAIAIAIVNPGTGYTNGELISVTSGIANAMFYINTVDYNETEWTFGCTGALTFPDATVQTTAWAGGKVVAAPAHSYGETGDVAGMLAFDASYIYYCTADYVNNTTDIWKRTAHGAGTW